MAAEQVIQLGKMYSDFASREAAGRSSLYEKLCSSIAADTDLLSRLSKLPLEKRQPNLLLAAVKYLFGTVDGWEHFRELTETHWDGVTGVILRRRTQTNEPARCATLLPLLALLPQPLALLEVGASAGLCLLPDHYSYDFGGHHLSPSVPVDSPPLFRCAVNEKTPIPNKNIEVVWRAGLDLSPLDPTRREDAAWLRALVWPGEGGRERLLDQALAIAALHPVRVTQGDLRYDLPSLASTAPRDATLVVFHTAVLAYVREDADRRAFGETVRTSGARWISNESASLWSGPDLQQRLSGRFLLALDGATVAYTEAHGTAIEWLG